MKVQVILDDNEIINVNDVTNNNDFVYYDNDNAYNHVNIFDDGITIERKAFDHSSLLYLRKDKYIEITSNDGKLKFFPKKVAINTNNDIITIVYKIDEENKKIVIKYLGD